MMYYIGYNKTTGYDVYGHPKCL